MLGTHAHSNRKAEHSDRYSLQNFDPLFAAALPSCTCMSVKATVRAKPKCALKTQPNKKKKKKNACDLAVFRTGQASQQMCRGKGEREGEVPITFGNQPSKGKGYQANDRTQYTSTAEARAFSSIVAFIVETGVAVRISALHTFCSPLFVFSTARHAPIPGDPFV